MRHMKKLSSLLLALVMVLAMSVPAFAAEGNLTDGSITINDAVPGQTYNAYQILYLESYNADDDAYAYKANTAWSAFINSSAIEGVYLNVDSLGYVTWIKENGDGDPIGMEEFAKLAQAEATKEGSMITADATETAPAAAQGATYSTVEFENLNLGYYLVDTTLGTLCSLDTTNPDATMREKNEVPSIEKKVKDGDSYEESNTAQIGDTVEFETTISAKPGAQNYVMHDKMSPGLTLDTATITVKVGDNTLRAGTDYTLYIPTAPAAELADECDFEIAFAQTYLNTITENTNIVVTYSAVLNDEAVISTDANTNETKLDYGDDSETIWDKTETYSFSFDIVKTKSESSGKYELLDGAEFELYDAETGGKKIPLVKDGENYRVATTAESTASGFESAVIDAEDGSARVIGLKGNTTYWLEETKQPDGYNRLGARVEVEIEDKNLSTTLAGTQWEAGDGGVHIINETGSLLPSAGGMGTTIFYVIGGLLVIASASLFIVRKYTDRRKNLSA